MNETIREHSWIPLILVACASFIITLNVQKEPVIANPTFLFSNFIK